VAIGDIPELLESVRADKGTIISASSSTGSYWGHATKRSKEEILQRRVVWDKSKCGLPGSREREVHHKNATYALSQSFGAVTHFILNNSEGEPESTKYSDIQSEYVGNLTKIKLSETRVKGYNMMSPFIIPELIDPETDVIKDCWGNQNSSGLNLL